MEKKEKHFVLIHGAGHGAWCWFEVATMRKSAGHKVTVLDMAASGINPKQETEIHSFSDYNEPFIQFVSSLPSDEKIILVDHSVGGANISVAMENFPEKFSVAVFASAFMLSENLTYPDIAAELAKAVGSFMDTQSIFDDGPNNPPTARLSGPQFLATNFYNFSPLEDLNLALSLVRPVRVFNDVALLLKETAVTKERNGRVPKVYIKCGKDKVVAEEVATLMIEKSRPDEVKMIPDSDHMVMFSKPVQLFSYLQEIADNY